MLRCFAEPTTFRLMLGSFDEACCVVVHRMHLRRNKNCVAVLLFECAVAIFCELLLVACEASTGGPTGDNRVSKIRDV